MKSLIGFLVCRAEKHGQIVLPQIAVGLDGQVSEVSHLADMLYHPILNLDWAQSFHSSSNSAQSSLPSSFSRFSIMYNL